MFDKPSGAILAVGAGISEVVPAIGSAMKGDKSNAKFIVDRAEKQMRYRCVFNCDGYPVVLWGPTPPTVVSEVAERVHNAATVTIQRLEPEYHAADLRAQFHCFHCPAVRAAFSEDNQDGRSLKVELVKGVCAVCLAVGPRMKRKLLAGMLKPARK